MPPTPAEPGNPPNPDPDYRTKFSESTRENQILREQLKDKDIQIQSLTKQHNPTEAELREANPDWDDLLPAEKRLARENLSMRKALGQTQAQIAELAADRKWEKDLRTAVKKYSKLKGREEEFEQFVFKPTHQGVAIDILAKAFLLDAGESPPAPPPTGGNPPPTGERGSGGPPPSSAKSKWTAAEVLVLQNSDPRKYRELLLKGEFENLE